MVGQDLGTSRDALCADLRVLRESGVLKLRQLHLRALTAIALRLTPGAEDASVVVDQLLRAAIGCLDGEEIGDVAGVLFGIATGYRGRPPAELRGKAAEIRGVSRETFRKDHEPLVIDEVARCILLVVQQRSSPPPLAPLPSVMSTDLATAIEVPLAQSPGNGTAHPVPGFLVTLDDLPRLQDLVHTATRIRVLSRTSVNLIGSYRDLLADALRRGCAIDVVVVDPSCGVAEYLYGKNTTLYRTNLAASIEHVRWLEHVSLGTAASFTLCAIDSFPPFSLMVIEQEETEESRIRVQLNFLHTRIGRDRPLFTLAPNDEWYDVFQREFDAIWRFGRTVSSEDLIG